MPTNQDMIRKEIDVALDKLGIVQKSDGVMTLDNTNFGGMMPVSAVDELLVLSYKQNDWLAALNNVRRQNRTGKVRVYNLNQNITEGIGSNEKVTINRLPVTANVDYNAKSFVSTYSIHMDEINEAKFMASQSIGGAEKSFEDVTAELFATQLGNDKANIIMNGDTTLDAETSLNRMLRMIDGVAIKSELGNVFDAEGVAFDKGIFTAMEDLMPEQYNNDPGRRWLYNSRVDTHFKQKLQALATQLGDKALTAPVNANPNGIPPVIVPHISRNKGPAAIAPTSAADNTTYIQFVLTTLVTAEHVASAAAGVGRKFKVTCLATGASEICTGILDTTLRINTAGLLGQTTVSTTNTDYEVGLYDETDLYLMNPKGITVVDCYEMYSYREFDPHYHRWNFITYFYMDVIIPNPDAIVKFKRVGVTAIETW